MQLLCLYYTCVFTLFLKRSSIQLYAEYLEGSQFSLIVYGSADRHAVILIIFLHSWMLYILLNFPLLSSLSLKTASGSLLKWISRPLTLYIQVTWGSLWGAEYHRLSTGLSDCVLGNRAGHSAQFAHANCMGMLD